MEAKPSALYMADDGMGPGKRFWLGSNVVSSVRSSRKNVREDEEYREAKGAGRWLESKQEPLDPRTNSEPRLQGDYLSTGCVKTVKMRRKQSSRDGICRTAKQERKEKIAN